MCYLIHLRVLPTVKLCDHYYLYVCVSRFYLHYIQVNWHHVCRNPGALSILENHIHDLTRYKYNGIYSNPVIFENEWSGMK